MVCKSSHVTTLTEPGSQAADLLTGNDDAFQVPSIFDADVLSALRTPAWNCARTSPRTMPPLPWPS
jgi:hypothetical protein